MDELNKFYKRTLVTCFMMLGHVYALVHFSYESRILSKSRLPRAFGIVGFVAYPVSIALLLPWLWSRHKGVLERLDSKYTPIWMKISAKQALILDGFDADDDDEDEEEEKSVKKPAQKNVTASKKKAALTAADETSNSSRKSRVNNQ